MNTVRAYSAGIARWFRASANAALRLRASSSGMKKLMHNEHGFIPLMLTVLAAIIAVVVFAYMRVKAGQ